MPRKVRVPRKYREVHRRAHERPRAVSLSVVKRAFSVWDTDGDGKISAKDLLRFVEKRPSLKRPREGWESFVVQMIVEALSRTGMTHRSGETQRLQQDDPYTLLTAASFDEPPLHDELRGKSPPKVKVRGRPP